MSSRAVSAAPTCLLRAGLSLSLSHALILSSSLVLGSSALLGCSDDEGAATDTRGSETGSSSETAAEGQGDGDGDPYDTEVDPEVAWPLLDCDPLVPDYCAYPFPNNVFSMDDDETATGRRLALSSEVVPTGAGYTPDTAVWMDSDGFSPSTAILAYFPGATIEGLATPETIEDSLVAEAKTVLLDAETGARVPHWAQLDMSHGDAARRALMIRPAVSLERDRRYIVAIRGLVDASGELIEASEAFAALRDLGESEAPSVEARRGLYADIFAHLGDAGVERGSLQLAWDFSTASDENITERLVHVRDEGLALFDANPDFIIDEIDLDPAPGVAMAVRGEIIVPLYLDDPGPSGQMMFGPDGLPEPTGTHGYAFEALIPAQAYSEPAGLLQFGHGLFGSAADIDEGLLYEISADYNFVVFTTTWIGMANEDIGHIVGLLQAARLDDFSSIVDRLGQGVLNALAAMRMMQGPFAAAPELAGPNMEPLMIDSDRRYFFGASLGGIMGSTYMALTTEVERGALVVPGLPFGLLLNRSEAFVQLSTLAIAAYDDMLALPLAYELMQIQWDRSEASGFARHIINEPLPGTQPHEVVVLGAMGDHLVSNYATHLMVREIGIPQLTPVNRSVFGIEEAEQPYEGSAFVEYDFGLPPIPITNVPMTEGSDPHGALASVPNAFLLAEQFVRTGIVETFCDGSCDPS